MWLEAQGNRVALLDLVQKNGICKGNLPLSLICAIRGPTLLQLLPHVVSVHHSDDTIEAHAAVELTVNP